LTVRNCARDEGGPFEVGNQVLISSHRKLLWSKAMEAICAVAASILTAAYHMLKNGTLYQGPFERAPGAETDDGEGCQAAEGAGG